MKTPTQTPALNIPSSDAHELMIMEMKMKAIEEMTIDLFILICFDYWNKSKR